VEVGSICLSLVSGGFETIPGTLTSVIGSLSTKEGQEIQKAAYSAILEAYNGDRDAAWKDCITEEKVDYINAIVKEGVRFYTVSSMSLPRKAMEDFHWHGSLIPKGTMVLISLILLAKALILDAQAANHDEAHFSPDAHLFKPERFVNMSATKGTSTLHFGFGAGSRMCAGHLIATRLCYSLLVRFILSFEVLASETNPPNTDYVEYNSIKTALVAIPRDFNVKLKMRDEAWLKGLVQQEPQSA
jgi:phenylacetate 2-hydroxylase